MATSVGDIEATLKLRDELTAELRRVNKIIEGSAKDMASAFKSAGQAAANIGDKLSTSITLPLAAAAAASLKFSTDFERNMTHVVTLSDVTEDNMRNMREEILALAPAVGKGPVELSDALKVITSTGLRGAEAMEILTSAAKAGATGLGETKDVARAVTAAMTAYGKETLSAGRATDILFAAVVQGGAEASEFAGTLGRVVGIASQVGVSFEEVAASVATFTRLGVDADEAVTALRGTLSVLLNPTKEARETLEQFGTSIEQVRQNVKEKGLMEALTDLVARTKGNDDAIASIIPNVRALAGVLGTAGAQAKNYKVVLDEVTKSSGDLDAAFKRTTETTGFKLSQFWADLQTKAIKAGDEMAPALTKILDAMKPLLTAVGDLVVAFSKLPGPVQSATLALGAFAIAIGPIMSVGGRLVSLIGTLLGAAGFGGVATAGPRAASAITAIGTAARGSTILMGGFTAALAGIVLPIALSKIAEALELIRGIMSDIEARKLENIQNASSHMRALAEASKHAGRPITDVNEAFEILRDRAAKIQFEMKGATVQLKSLGGVAIPGVTQATTEAAKKTATFADELAEAQKKINGLSKTAKDDLVKAIKSGAFQMEDLKKKSGLTETAIKLLTEQIEGATSAQKDWDEELRRREASRIKFQEEWRQFIHDLRIFTTSNIQDRLKDLGIRPENLKQMAQFHLETRAVIHDLSELNELKNETGIPIPDPFMPMLITSEQLQEHLDKLEKKRKDFRQGISELASSLANLGQVAGGAFGEFAKQLATIVTAFDVAVKASDQWQAGMREIRSETGDASKGFTQLATSALSAAAAFVQVTGEGNTLMRALGGAAIGAQFGEAVGGGIGAAVGAAIGAIVGVVRGLFDRNKGRDMIEEFAEGMGGFDLLRLKLRALGDEGERVWQQMGHVGSNNTKQAKAAIDALNVALAQVPKALNDMLNAALKTGQGFDTVLAPLIRDLIKTGQLTEQNANLLMGLPENGVPAFAEVQAAAERLGVTLEAAGQGIQQLRIKESAELAAKDLMLMRDAGADMLAVLTMSAPKIQALVNDAIRFGSSLPMALKPFLQQMVEAGLLTDLTGEKLDDLSDLHFTEPLEKSVDRLIEKLDELIMKLTGGVGGALDELGRKVVKPTIEYHETRVRDDSGVSDPYVPELRGGTHGMFPDWGSEGTLVRLHGKERVMTEAERHGAAGGGMVGAAPIYVTSQLVVDGQLLAQVTEKAQINRVMNIRRIGRG